MHFSLVDTTKLTEEFGFHAAWTARECAEDFSRANRAHVVLGVRQYDLPWRWPWAAVPEAPEQTQQRNAAELGVAGEFDINVDPQWTTLRALQGCLGFPAPATPLRLELAVEAFRAGGALAAELLGVDGEIGEALAQQPIGVFGHRLYVNSSLIDRISSLSAELFQWPRSWSLSVKQRVLARATRQLDDDARAAQRNCGYYAALSDEQLICRLRQTADEVANAWAATLQPVVFVAAWVEVIQKRGKSPFDPLVDCAEAIANTVAVQTDSESVDGACENRASPHRHLMGLLATDPQRAVAHGRDAALRWTNQYRLIAAELGSRLMLGGFIAAPQDVQYCVRCELTRPPPDLASRVDRRRAEYVRLQKQRPPATFTRRWNPSA